MNTGLETQLLFFGVRSNTRFCECSCVSDSEHLLLCRDEKEPEVDEVSRKHMCSPTLENMPGIEENGAVENDLKEKSALQTEKPNQEADPNSKSNSENKTDSVNSQNHSETLQKETEAS